MAVDIKATLHQLLAANGDLVDIVAARIFPQQAHQHALLPYVLYALLNLELQPDSVGAPGEIARAHFQVDCLAESYATAEAMASAIRGHPAAPALDGFRGLVGTTRVQAARVDDAADDMTPPQHAGEQSVEWVGLDVVLWYEE